MSQVGLLYNSSEGDTFKRFSDIYIKLLYEVKDLLINCFVAYKNTFLCLPFTAIFKRIFTFSLKKKKKKINPLPSYIMQIYKYLALFINAQI